MKLILGSGSPRRKELLQDLGFDFQVRVKETDESYPDHLRGEDIPKYIAKQKALAVEIAVDEVLLTADTTVHTQSEVLGKPDSPEEAFEMISKLSNNTHLVTTGICIRTNESLTTDSATTKVQFGKLSDADIWHYINTYKPFDKAGAYGIQEWIGQIGIDRIEGCYFNVVGLPTSLVYSHLKHLLSQ